MPHGLKFRHRPGHGFLAADLPLYRSQALAHEVPVEQVLVDRRLGQPAQVVKVRTARGVGKLLAVAFWRHA
jgi:hypothetical protein